MPLALLLRQVADQAEQDALYQSEREAVLTDARNAAAQREDAEWETVTADGID